MYKGIDFYNLAMSVSGAAWGALGKVVQQESEPAPDPPLLMRLRAGRAEAPAWFLVQALEFDPEPISVVKLRVRDIYASERIVFALLELMASEGWLTPVDEESYIFAPAGRQLANRRRDRITHLLSQLTDLETDIARLASLLDRIIVSSLHAGDPPGTWCLHYSRRRAPDAAAPPLVHIQQYWADFNAFRDDAHMAAFKPFGLAAFAWEAFSHVWEGKAGSAAEIREALYFRGYSETEYAAALDGLVTRGWLRPRDGAPGRFELTAAGSDARQQAEDATNEYFYAPWSILSDAEVDELHGLMVALQDELRGPAEDD